MPTDIRLGMQVRADKTGLGHQTYTAWKFLKPQKTMVIDIKEFNGNESDYSKYPDAQVVQGFPTDKDIYEFLKDLDVVFCFETPYNYDLFTIARELGVKTILQFNYEFLDYLNRPNLPKPDMLVAPNPWKFEEAKQAMAGLGIPVELLVMPIDRDVLPYREVRQIKTFLHIAGKRTYMDRNGTDIVLAAIPYVKSNVKFIINTQQDLPPIAAPNVQIIKGDAKHYSDIYKEGDVLLMPRKYAGSCMPLNESMATGLIPLMTDCEPQSMFLQPESLVTPFNVKKIMTRCELDCYEVSPIRLAGAIDAMASLPEERIRALAEFSNFFAQRWSWREMLPKYKRLIEYVKTNL